MLTESQLVTIIIPTNIQSTTTSEIINDYYELEYDDKKIVGIIVLNKNAINRMEIIVMMIVQKKIINEFRWELYV